MQIKKHIFTLLITLVMLSPTSASALSCLVPIEDSTLNFGGVAVYGYNHIVERELLFLAGDYIQIPLVAGDGGCEAPKSIYIHYLSLFALILLSVLVYMYYRIRRGHSGEKSLDRNKNAN